MLQEARHYPFRSEDRHRAVTACKHTVSGTISLPSRGAFHLSLTVLVRYRSVGIFSLTEWSPWIHASFHVARATQVPARLPRLSSTKVSSRRLTPGVWTSSLQSLTGFGKLVSPLAQSVLYNRR